MCKCVNIKKCPDDFKAMKQLWIFSLGIQGSVGSKV